MIRVKGREREPIEMVKFYVVVNNRRSIGFVISCPYCKRMLTFFPIEEKGKKGIRQRGERQKGIQTAKQEQQNG
jgi:hypothetical protein